MPLDKTITEKRHCMETDSNSVIKNWKGLELRSNRPMNGRREQAVMKLPIPQYRQATQFTCGPACLMMAMKFFQPNLRLTRELEFDIWREANLVESYGTSKEGLALAAARRGFHVYTLGGTLRHSFLDAIKDQISNIDWRVLELLYEDTKTKFRSKGLRNRSSRIDLSKLRQILLRSHVPILLTSTLLFHKGEDLPHWVVVTGYGRDGWYVNNPLARTAHTKIGHEPLRSKLGYHGVRCAVVVCGPGTDEVS